MSEPLQSRKPIDRSEPNRMRKPGHGSEPKTGRKPRRMSELKIKRKPVNAGSPSQTTVTGLNEVDTRESTLVIRIASMTMLPMIMSGRAVMRNGLNRFHACLTTTFPEGSRYGGISMMMPTDTPGRSRFRIFPVMKINMKSTT